MIRINRLFPTLTIILAPLAHAQTAAQIELFEKNARPLFSERCQVCHNAKLKSGGIDLSSTEGIKEAASSGIFGSGNEPEKSVILQALGYESRVKMPPQGKLPAETIASVREWVAAGAPVPGAVSTADTSSTGLRPVALRGKITDADRQFWSFKPNARPKPPEVDRKDWSADPIDRFVLANLHKNGLEPAPPASKLALIRRATFDLTGLPPTEKEINAFLADQTPKAYEKLVDRLLASPR